MLGAIEGLAILGTGIVIGVFLDDAEILTADHVRTFSRYANRRCRAYLNGADLTQVTPQPLPGTPGSAKSKN